jgi:hypothetical protein
MKSFNLTEEVVRLFLIQYSDDQNELRTLVHTDLEEIITQHDRLRIRNNNITLGSFEIPHKTFKSTIFTFLSNHQSQNALGGLGEKKWRLGLR